VTGTLDRNCLWIAQKNQTFVNKNFAWSNPGAVGGLMQTNSNTLFDRERFY